MSIERKIERDAQHVAEDDAEWSAPVAGGLSALSWSQKATAAVNIGLFLSIVVSVVSLFPVRWPFADRLQIRLYSSLAVLPFLDSSFWLAGWPGSALGITLLGVVLAFTALVGQELGLVGTVFSFLGSVLGLLLMLSDLPFLRDGEWVSRSRLAVYIGILANLVVAALSVALWAAFGGA